mgnify:CR=1 FL=1|jgi:hypothetical protein
MENSQKIMNYMSEHVHFSIGPYTHSISKQAHT